MAKNEERIAVLIEQSGGQVLPVAFELLNAGRQLARSGGQILCACVLGRGIADACEDIAFYADEVFAVDNRLLTNFQAEIYASALESVCKAIAPVSLLMEHSYENCELAPKIGYRTGGEVVTDCMRIERDDAAGSLLCTKPVYGNRAIAVLELKSKPQIVTIRAKVYEALQRAGCRGRVIPLQCGLDPSLTRVKSVEIVPGQNVSIDKAEAVVSGGRGVKTQEGINQLRRMAATLERFFHKVEVGASRPVVDAGLLSRSHQVGQTGERVSPQLYIAVAISGAVQHVSGIVGSKKIIAINKDAEAPIFDVSDYGVVGSFEEVIPAFIEQLEGLS
ncbi:MAG: electron transfer flavoprotein subunit alpha/FixB family protein [Thermodesulfobacteriota bacterium]